MQAAISPRSPAVARAWQRKPSPPAPRGQARNRFLIQRSLFAECNTRAKGSEVNTKRSLKRRHGQKNCGRTVCVLGGSGAQTQLAGPPSAVAIPTLGESHGPRENCYTKQWGSLPPLGKLKRAPFRSLERPKAMPGRSSPTGASKPQSWLSRMDRRTNTASTITACSIKQSGTLLAPPGRRSWAHSGHDRRLPRGQMPRSPS